MSYSEFKYSDLEVFKKGINQFEISCTVENVSDTDGKEVVQLYIHGSGNTIKRRALELKGFCKTELGAHEKKRITFNLGYDELKIYSAGEQFEVEEGRVEIFIGMPNDFALKAEIETQPQNLSEL